MTTKARALPETAPTDHGAYFDGYQDGRIGLPPREYIANESYRLGYRRGQEARAAGV